LKAQKHKKLNRKAKSKEEEIDCKQRLEGVERIGVTFVDFKLFELVIVFEEINLDFLRRFWFSCHWIKLKSSKTLKQNLEKFNLLAEEVFNIVSFFGFIIKCA
jgi:hypothetical protein